MRESEVSHVTGSLTTSPAESFATASSCNEEPMTSHAFAGVTSSVSTEPSGGWVGSSPHETANTTHATARNELRAKIGRASCRERGESTVGAVSIEKKRKRTRCN